MFGIARKAPAGLIACSLLAAAPAQAVVINDTNGLPTAEALGASSEVASVVKVTDGAGLCSGVLISPTAVATARHCVDAMTHASIQVQFTDGAGVIDITRNAVSVSTLTPQVDNPGTVDDESLSYFTGTDMAIVELGTPVTTYTPFKVFAHDFGAPIFNELVAFAGYGAYGLGSTGFTSSGDGVRRAAQNVMDALDAYSTPGGTNYVFYADFDKEDESTNITGLATPVPAEGLIGPGDSGGPLLFLRDGEWVVAGVLTGFYDLANAGSAAYGDVAAWTGFYSTEARSLLETAGATFYVASVPLPAGAWLLGSAVGFMAWRRRKPT